MHTSYLSLSFDEAADPARFSKHITKTASKKFLNTISPYCNPALKTALTGAKVALNNGVIKTTFSTVLPEGAKLMLDTAGKKLPILVSKSTGRTLEIARVVGKGVQATNFAIDSYFVALEVAHFVSAKEQVNYLREISEQVEKLIHFHESALSSRLESIYRHAKEIVIHSNGSLSEFDRMELSGMCRELMELRAQWRKHFCYNLNQIDEAKANFLTKLPFADEQASKRKSSEQRAQEAMAQMEELRWIHMSLMLQFTLSQYTQRSETFINHTLRDEMQSWGGVIRHAVKRSKEISGSKGIYKEWQAYLRKLRAVKHVWDLPPLTAPCQPAEVAYLESVI